MYWACIDPELGVTAVVYAAEAPDWPIADPYDTADEASEALDTADIA